MWATVSLPWRGAPRQGSAASVREAPRCVGVSVGSGKRAAVSTDSYLWYDNGVAVSKVSLSIDEDVLAEARERAGRRELSSYVNDALRRQLQHDRIADLLAEMDDEAGPIPAELMEEARELWRGIDKPKARRRSA